MADSQNAPASPGFFVFVRKGLRAVLVGLFAAVATYVGMCGLLLAAYGAVFPPITGVQLQRNVEAWREGLPPERRYEPIPLHDMAPSLPRAVVAAEDSRFFTHYGIDWSMVEDAIGEYQGGKDLRGASTITQQLVKNLFLTTHRTYLRKALEVPLAYLAELLLSKQRILELHLNVVEWGPGVYGVAEGAAYHYGQPAASLTASQSAGLAACLPNPRVRRPQTMGWYQRIILRRMSNLEPLPLSTSRPSP